MKALTIKQPWASAIMAGVKRVENRTWATAHRGPLVIHAGRTIDPEGVEMLLAGQFELDPELTEDPPSGVILGVVELVDCVRFNPAQRYIRGISGYCDPHGLQQDPLATGPVCWILKNPRPFRQPLLHRGRRGLWHIALSKHHGSNRRLVVKGRNPGLRLREAP